MIQNPKFHISVRVGDTNVDVTFSVDYSVLEVIELQSLIILAQEEIKNRMDDNGSAH